MPDHKLLPLALAALTTTLLATPAHPQEEPAAGFEELVEVTEVLLDVLATDRSGEVVTGLGKDDFVVLEDGEPVAVTGVSFYTTRYGDGDEPLPDAAVPSSRYFILFFDDLSRDGLIRRQLDAARGARRWVEEHMLPSDWVAVASYDVKLKIHQDFTQNRDALLAGIDSAARRRDPEKNVGRRELGRGGRRLPPSGAPSLLRQLPQGKALRKKTKRIYDGVRLVAEAAGFIVGRKNLVLFSIGFGELDSTGLIARGDRRYYPRMEQALNDHNVAIYPVDLARSVNHLQSSFLSQLASDTGGYYYRGVINFLAPLKQISQENSGYYLLSYQSEHPAAEAGYQEVKVKARDRAFKVRARKGYRYGVQDDPP